MPRGRQRKPRLSRLDAAVDAMTPFGFPVEKVKKHVKELLKVYGGDEAWPFIEEYSYKELLDALLRDVEGSDREQVTEDGDQSKLLNKVDSSSHMVKFRRRQPCYGWIDSDEEDVDDLVISVPLPPELYKFPSDGNKSRRKRKSGWDVRPDDPNWP